MKESITKEDGKIMFRCYLGDCHGSVRSDNPADHEAVRQSVRKLYEECLVQEDMFLRILDSRISNRPDWLTFEGRREFAREAIQDAVNKIKTRFDRKY